LWEQLALPLYLKTLDCKCLLISLGNTAPILIKSQIYTLHDIGFKTHPQWYSKKFSMAYNIMIPLLLKRCKHVLTVSETSKKRITNTFGVPSHKISVIYNGVALPETVKVKNYELAQSRYILSVSSFNPRKNLKRLIEAFLLLEDKNIHLFLVGNFSENFKNEGIEAHDRIHYLSGTDDFALVELYKNANLFVYPSLYEGFGIPILEAMYFNLQICASNIPSFNEIFGDRLIYFNPKSVSEIKKSLEKGLQKPVEKDQYNSLLQKYNWDHSVDVLQKIIFEILNQNNEKSLNT
jgi:glycosyltransferase involved in cell wall biosynthesis